MNKKFSQTRKIALCGVISALAVVIMASSTLFSIASYSLAALAGVLLILLVIETGTRYAAAAYFIISLLSSLLLPDKETAMIFALFLGYYPILKAYFERIPNRVTEYLAKFGLFNLAMAIFYFIITRLFHLEVIENTSLFNSLPVLLILANITFFLYDIALTRLISAYLNVFRSRFSKWFK